MQTRNFFLGGVLGSLLGVAAFSQPSPIQISARFDQDSADRKSGVIQGQVSVAEGEVLLAEATVVLYAADGRGNERPRTARTDDRGRFRLFDIPPGSYYLRADTPLVWGGSGEGDRAFPPTFYPGVLSPRDATKVQVTAGQEVGGFFFTLIETQTRSVSGRVLTAEGKPAHTVWIMSRRESADTHVFGPESSANTNLQGEFRVSRPSSRKTSYPCPFGEKRESSNGQRGRGSDRPGYRGLDADAGSGCRDRRPDCHRPPRLRSGLAAHPVVHVPGKQRQQRFFRWGRRPRGSGFHFQGVETVGGPLSPGRLAPEWESLCLLRTRRRSRHHRSPNRVEK